jgi:hypothetical protein
MFVNFNILNQLGSPAINSNTYANRPAAGQTGRLFVSTDTFEIYRDNGTTWDLIGGPGTSTITGTGTATQVAYFTSSQAIGSSANLFWDNTNGFLGVGTAVPSARVEAVKTDGYGIYANYTTNAGSGASATAIYSLNTTAGSGYAAVIEEKTGNTTGGQYPLLVKHSLSSGTAAVGNGTGLQFQLQDDAGTFKTTQLTIETIDAAAATYATRYRFNVQSAGSSTPAAYLNATGLGLGTATPGAKLDIHSTGTLAQLNSTGATNNGYLAFQRAGTTTFSIGDTYNAGSNYFRIYSNTLAADVAQIFEATGKTNWQATQTYTTGLARGNYFDYNVSVAAGGSFSSPNSISAVGATLDLTLAGNATIPSGARSGLDAYNTVSFTGTGTLTHSQGTQIRAYSNLTTGWAFAGSATGTITHLAGLRVLFPDNSGSAVTVTNNYGLLINDQTANTGTVTYTNRWGIYQEGSLDTNHLNGTTLIGTATNAGYKLDVNGSGRFSNLLRIDGPYLQIVNITNPSVYLSNGTVQWQMYNNASNNLVFKDGSSDILTIGYNGAASSLSLGNLGLGTSTPNGKMTVIGNTLDIRNTAGSYGTGYALEISTNANIPRIDFIDNGTYTGNIKSVSSELIINNTSNNALIFQTNNTSRGRFTAGGNFLIGTTTDNGETLQVNGTTRTQKVQYTTNTIANSTTTVLAAGLGATNYFAGSLANTEKCGINNGTYNFGYYVIFADIPTIGRGHAIFAWTNSAASGGFTLISGTGLTWSATYNAAGAVSFAFDASTRGPFIVNNSGATGTFYMYVTGGA